MCEQCTRRGFLATGLTSGVMLTGASWKDAVGIAVAAPSATRQDTNLRHYYRRACARRPGLGSGRIEGRGHESPLGQSGKRVG